MLKNFLTQGLREPSRKDALLDLFVNTEGLMGDVMIGDCLGHIDHEMVEFKIFSVARNQVSRVLSYSGSYLAEYPDFEGL